MNLQRISASAALAGYGDDQRQVYAMDRVGDDGVRTKTVMGIGYHPKSEGDDQIRQRFGFRFREWSTQGGL